MHYNGNQFFRHRHPQPDIRHPRGEPRGMYANNPPHNQNMQNQPGRFPPPYLIPSPPSSTPAPVQITLTVNPQQLLPSRHHEVQRDYQRYSPQSEAFYDRPPTYSDQPPPYSANFPYSHSTTSYNCQQRGSDAHNLPPRYSPGASFPDVIADYPQDLQSRSRGNEETSSNYEPGYCGRGRGRGRGKERGGGHSRGKTMETVGSRASINDSMPLGSEASGFQRNEFRRHKDFDNYDYNDSYGGGKDNDDDNVSVQSMPTGGKCNQRQSRQGNRGHRRGQNVDRANAPKIRTERVKNEKEEDGDTESLLNSQARFGKKGHHKNKQPIKNDVDNVKDTESVSDNKARLNKMVQIKGKQPSKNSQDSVKVKDTDSLSHNNADKVSGKYLGKDKQPSKLDQDSVNQNVKPKRNSKVLEMKQETPPLRNEGRSPEEKHKDIDYDSTSTSHGTLSDSKSFEKKKRIRRKKNKTQQSDNDQHLTNKLNVSLRINSLFDDVNDLKSTISQAFDFPNRGKFDVKFTSEALIYKTKLSNCSFVITTSNAWIAKKCVKSMVLKLKQNLKTFVHYRMYINKKDESAHCKEVKYDEETKNSQHDKKDGSSNKETCKKEMLKNSCGKIDKCPVIFNLTVEKSFAKPDGFISFVTTLVNGLTSIDEFDLKEESIILSQTSSQCTVHLQSKADSKRLIKTVIKLQKETELNIKFDVIKLEQQSQEDEKETNSWNSRIQKILTKIEDTKNAVLSAHKEKISCYRSQIKRKKQAKAERDAVEDKLTEASLQENEFMHKCNYLNSAIKAMKPGTTRECDLKKLQQDFGIECQRLRSSLPIYARRQDIITRVTSNQVSIILGETGSGKSTQIAQYLYEAGIATDGVIVCTQPRKVAAAQLADRVAQEMVVKTGDIVGFKAGNKRKISDNTKIVFMTDHSLLTECLEDRDFTKYSCIIVDEAHERSIYTDILLGMIKSSLKRRPDLRVVITSATINPQVFIDYFQCSQEIRVSGRTYPVEVFYMESSDDFENYETKAVSKASEIHINEPEGDILVFLTSPVEIQRCCEEFCNKFKDRNDFKCLPLHGQLLSDDQRKVFSKLNPGVRKVVFATNCAETSITIDGIRYVIDTGVSKEMRYDAKKNLNLLGVHMISQSSANQRKGRAGRTASGKCYRLFSEEGFNAMAAINEPEILRVHLGQAILKLAELGVNICEYDYVEAPSYTALHAALKTLEFLGAIDNEKITDTGRWISKLPFDPKLGYLVFQASKENMIFDAIVLASVVSNGSSLFYRGLTETEAQIAERSKAQFGLENGDMFTWFTIYKMWEALPRKDKRKWCQSNSINYKCMNFIKTCIDDAITALSNDMKVDILKEYSAEASSMAVLSKFVFRAYGLSLCHYMGHSRAGYFSLFSERQVHFHPSCTLATQNIQPEWLVFGELVKTSREFIKGILVVDEEWIQEAIDDGHLNIDLTKAKEKTLSKVHTEELGMSLFKAVVGPRYSNLKYLEELSEKHGMEHTIFEADRDLGTLSIYTSSPEIHPEVVNWFTAVKSEIVKKLQTEESECRIFSKGSGDSPNIRAIVGCGACVRQVLMPHQTTQVLIRKVGDAKEEDILTKFGEFGDILEIISFKSQEPWGFVRYQSIEEATIAVQRTKEDQMMIGTLRLERGYNDTKNMFQAKVSWLRRPVKGEGTVFIKCDPIDKAELIGRLVILNGIPKQIHLSNKNKQKNVDLENQCDLVIFKVGEITEEVVRDEINNIARRQVDMKITIPRLPVPVPDPQELENIKSRLQLLIDPNKEEKFTVWVTKPNIKSFYHTAFLYFTDPVRGLHICKLNHQTKMDGHLIMIAPSLKTTILVPNKIKDACKKQMDELFTSMKKDLGVSLEWGKLKEDHAITIKSQNPEGIVKARECIMKELKGDTIDCNLVKSCQCLLTQSGQHYLQETQKHTDCVIISDKRTKMIHLYGKSCSVSHAKIEINKYLMDNESKKKKILKLKGSGKPPGLMKEMMKKFGPFLDGLTKDYNLSSVSVDWKSHTIRCAGSDTDIEELEKYISGLENELYIHYYAKEKQKDKEMPECSVCMCSVETKQDLYRLEICGHPYCLLCLQFQSKVCVQNKHFPLSCAKENCTTKLAWKDVRFMLSRKWITEEKLINFSLTFLVETQSQRYKFCPTPNCPVVYEVTLDENGCEFNCVSCFASTCRSCHVPFHTGVSCRMAKSGTSAELDLVKWSAENPTKRKICPGCISPIEKLEGCNKMRCDSCHIVFCWICLEMFEDSQKCYAHLVKKHGAIH